MRFSRGLGLWRPVVGVAAVGVLAFGLALQGAPPKGDPAAQRTGAGAVIAGPGVPLDGSVPMFPPVVVDYRDKDPVSYYGAGERAVGVGDLSVWEPYGTLSRADHGDPCLIHEQCYTCNVCIEYECTDSLCAEDVLAGPDATEVDGCDDGLYCNGDETCDGGVCLAGTDVTCGEDEYCDDYENQCRADCVGDEDCDDALYCTTDSCNLVSFECEHTNACGPNARCLEPVAPDTGPVCIEGRCCTPTKGCTRTIYDDCAVGSNWLGVGGSTTTCEDEPCPVYGAGIVADSNLIAEIGPISSTDCDVLVTVGDDYQTWEHNPKTPDDNYMLVERLRWVARVEPGAQDGVRWSIEFRDENGVFIENVFFPNGQNDEDGFGIRTAIFDPALAIPTKGIVSFSVQANFGLDGRTNLWATDIPTIGVNDPTSMYIQRSGEAAMIRDYLGICVGGPAPPNDDGQVCDRFNANADCDDGAGTCFDEADTLAFELLGTGSTKPDGACCNSVDGTCTQSLPWMCAGAFQGEGTLCGYCDANSPPELIGEPCTPAPAPDECWDETFPGTCVVVAACETAACCNTATGGCRGVTSTGACDDPGTEEFLGFGTDCDPNCCEQPVMIGADNCRDAELTMPLIQVPPLAGGETLSVTITGNNSGATPDDVNLICLDGPFPDRPCADEEGAEDDSMCGQCIGGSNPGDPCVNSAECLDEGVCDDGDCGPLCGAGFMDPEGGTRDPGWWNAFTIDACAEVRLDLCCTDIEGDVLRPAWAMLYADCPCGDVQNNIGVPPPIGKGRDTAGFARGGPFCSADNLWMTYLLNAGTYYYPIYSAYGGTSGLPPGTDYQFHITVKACPIAVCCTRSTCQYTNELECDELGGNWLIGNLDCGADPNCTLPPAETDNPCCTGACCIGPGECEDRVPVGGTTPMTEPDCVTRTGEDPPPYIGGAACDDDPFPCPVCPVESEENCQETATATAYISDTQAVEDMRRADDFIASAETIYQVCVTGSWIDDETDCSINGIPNRCDCACIDDDQINCIPVEVDVFTVCVYEDAGLALPQSSVPVEVPIGCSGASMMRVNFQPPDSAWNFDEWMISLTLDSGIGPMNIGGIYWVSVSDYTEPNVALPDIDCNWRWSRDGTCGEADEECSGNDWHMFDFNGVWEGLDGQGVDMSFCLDQRIEPPPIPATGACCLCDPLGDCIDGTTLTECNEMLGAWKIAEVCATPNLCPQTRPANDDCTTYRQEVFEGLEAFNNLCATTDGPDEIPCEQTDLTDIGADVWFEYTATCSGRLIISMCEDADFDSALAVYSDGTDTCVCPTDTNLMVICGDDTCGIGGGPPLVEVVEPTIGACYTLQFGGWRDTRADPLPECVHGCQGSGSFTIECEGPGVCPPSSAPQGDYSPVPADAGAGTKNRYMTFRGGDEGRSQAARVKFMSLPYYLGDEPPANYDFRFAEGRTMFVQEPLEVTEAGGSAGPVPPPTMWAATLGCDPYYTDWTQYDRVDVYNAGILPDGIYQVQFIDEDPGCFLSHEEDYSAPLQVVMSKAGDVTGSSPGPAPQGVVDFVDIAAIVDKFKNAPGALRKARADITPGNLNQADPDRKIDFVDISCVVSAFRAEPCRLVGPPETDPCE